MADDFIPFGPAPKQSQNDGFIPMGETSDKPAPDRKALDNAPGETDGVLKNLGTAAIKGLAHIPGQLGDIAELPGHVADMAVSRATKLGLGKRPMEISEVQKLRQAAVDKAMNQAADFIPGGAWAKRQIESIPRYLRPLPSGADLAKPILEKTGEYEPTTEAGKLGAIGVEGGLSMLGPGILGSPLRAGEAVLAGSLTPMAGHVVGEATGSPEAELATNALVPIGVGKVGNAVSHGAKSFSAKAQRAEADSRMLEQTQDPAAAISKLNAEPKGSLATTAEVTGDAQHAQAEDLLRTHHTGFKQDVQTRIEGPRNAELRGKLDSMAPVDADPTAVSSGFQQHLDNLRGQVDPITAPEANVSGEALRETAAGQKETVRGLLDKLKATIDPDNKLNVWTKDVADHANSVLGEAETRPFKAESPLAKETLGMAAKLGEVSKFSDLVDLDQSVSAAMKKANSAMNPDAIGYAQLVGLKGKIKEAINNAVEHQHAWEQNAVRRGEMQPGDTFASRLERERADWLAARKADQAESSGTSARANDAGGPDSVRSVPGGQPENVEGGPSAQGAGPAGGGRPNAGGPGTVPDDGAGIPNLTDEAASRLALFNKGYGQYKDTFDKGPVGAALKSDFGKPRMMAADVANKAFVSGPKGYETAQAWLKAGGDGAKEAMKDIATSRLQADLKGKPLDQRSLDAWRAKYGDSLRALNEVEPGFSDKFNSIASAQESVRGFEKSSAAKFLGLEHPDDIANNVGRLMSSESGAAKISELMEHARNAGEGGEAIIAGIRRAGTEWLKNRFSNQAELPNGKGGSDRVLSDGLKDFIETHRNVLETMFDPAAVKTMDQVADTLKRSALVKMLQSARGSPTAQRQSGLLQTQLQLAAKHELAEGMNMAGTLNVMAGLELIRDFPSFSGMLRGMGLLAARSAFGKMRTALADRFGGNEVRISNMVAEGFANPEIGKVMLERAMDAKGNLNPDAFRKLYQAMIASHAIEHQADEKREGRASGGKVGVDHVKAGAHMVGLVEKARKMEQAKTKPLLNAHDDAVAHALAVANRAI